MRVKCPWDYPLKKGPIVEFIDSSHIKENEKNKLFQEIEDMAKENNEMTIVFSLISEIQTFLQTRNQFTFHI